MSFYNTTLVNKGTNHVGQLFDTNGAMKPWSVLKSEFRLSKNSHFMSFSGHHITKKCQIYSLTKCSNKELYSLQVFLNDSRTKW